MELSNIQNSRTIDVINLSSDSSTASPARVVTSSSPKDFMEKTPRPEKRINNIVQKLKASNKDFVEQTPQNNDSNSNTDYANIITIKKQNLKHQRHQKTTTHNKKLQPHKPSNSWNQSNRMNHNNQMWDTIPHRT